MEARLCASTLSSSGQPAASLLTNFTVSFGRLSLRGSANVDLGGFVHVLIDVPFEETVTESRHRS